MTPEPLPTDPALQAYVLAALANGSPLDIETETKPRRYVTLIRLDEDDRRILARWLKTLPTPPPRILREIDGALDGSEVKGTLRMRIKERKLDFNLQVKLPTDRAKIAYLFAGVIASRQVRNIPRCAECEIYFVDMVKQKGTPPMKFCSSAHANAHRQRVYRNRQKQRKMP